MTEEEKIQVRKYQDVLSSGGIGVIILGLWRVFKLIMLILLNTDQFLGDVPTDDVPEVFLAGIIFVVIFVMVFFSFTFDLYVALSAIAEGHSKKAGSMYLVICGLILIAKILSVPTYFLFPTPSDTDDVSVASAILDFTSTVIYAQVFWSALSLRRIRRRNGGSL